MSKINFIARRAIEKGREDGKSCRKIAQEIGVSKSAVAYEINRYKLPNGNYYAELAHWMSQKISRGRNQKRGKFLQKKLLLIIDKLLRDRRSPKDISLYLKKMYPDQKDLQISHESIYKLAYCFANLTGNPCRSWYRYLLRKRKKRRFRHQPEPYRRCYRRSIHAMLPGLKKAFGVWQMDIMYIKNGYIFVVVETVSKKVMAKLVYDLKAETIQKACRFLFSRVEDIKAMICDRGSENSGFRDMQRILHTVFYFCDAGKPYQKGLVEQTNGILRKYLPRNTDARSLTQKDVYKYAARLNSMHRVSLNGRTASEVYAVLI